MPPAGSWQARCNVVERLCGWAEHATRLVAWFGMLLLVCAVLVTVTDILTRRSVNVSIYGLVDLTQLFVMGFVFLSIPYGFMLGSHVSVEFATDALSPRTLAGVKSLAALLGTVLMLAICSFSWSRAMQQIENGDVSQTLGMPFIWYWAPLLFGALLSVATGLLQTARFLMVVLFGTAPTDHAQAVKL